MRSEQTAPTAPSRGYRLRGVLLSEQEQAELRAAAGGLISAEPVAGARTLVWRGWIVPGLVDAHCHVGVGAAGPTDLPGAEEQVRVDRDSGALLLRDCGSPVDARPLRRLPRGPARRPGRAGPADAGRAARAGAPQPCLITG